MTATAHLGELALRPAAFGRSVAAMPHRIRQESAAILTDTDGELLAGFAISLRADSALPATVELYVGTAQRIAAHSGRSLLDVDSQAIRAYYAHLVNPRTRYSYYCGGARLFGWLQTEGHRSDNPMEAVARPRRPRGTPRPCSTIALHQMLNIATTEERALLLLGCYQGLRAHETAKFSAETDVDLYEHKLYVLGKGGVNAVLPLHPEVAASTRSMPAVGCWFPSRRGGSAIGGPTVTHRVQDLARRAGVQVTGIPAAAPLVRHPPGPLRHRPPHSADPDAARVAGDDGDLRRGRRRVPPCRGPAPAGPGSGSPVDPVARPGSRAP